MRFSTAIASLVVVSGAKADGVRKIKSSRSASGAETDGSWWGPAPAPATWGPAPTWAAPAPATWVAPATWAAPAAAAAVAHCKQIWLDKNLYGEVSEELCTLSGYMKLKLAKKGPINEFNTIKMNTLNTDKDGGGSPVVNTNKGAQKATDEYSSFSSLITTQKGATLKTSSTASETEPAGYIADMSVTTNNVNNAGAKGLSYCQCIALTVHNCDPGMLVVPPTAATGYSLDKTAPALAAAAKVPAITAGVDSDKLFSYLEYSRLALKIADTNTVGGYGLINTQSEADGIIKLAESLGDEANKCAPLAYMLTA